MVDIMEDADLLKKIEEKREQMMHAAQFYGLNHELTITYSQELDVYLNQLNNRN